MFSIAQLGRVWWPVTLSRYDESGTLVQTTIRLLFEPLTREEMHARRTALLKSAGDGLRQLQADTDLGKPADPDASIEKMGQVATDRVLHTIEANFAASTEDFATLVARTHDWRGIVDVETEAEVPFSRDVFASLLKHDLFAKPVLEAFNAASEGAVRKNSEPGPAGTPA